MGRKLAIKKEQVQFEVVEEKNWKQKSNVVKKFVAWDGEETRDGGYCLFGNSTGLQVKSPNLSTGEMLDLIIRTGKIYPQSFHVGFAFFYDVNNILKDIGKLRIAILHKTGSVNWQGYHIEHIPHKIFTVSRKDEETGKTVRVRIDDCFTFFRQRFDKALIKYGIGTEEERAAVTKGKDERAEFWWRDIDYIESYWKLELKLLVQLMDRLREDINGAGILIGQWHGPGALASYALRQHEMGKYKRETPPEILDSVLSAYSAGWFERFQAGFHDGPVWTADINSAYVHAISLLPNLAVGDWEYVDNPTPELVLNERFGIYHIRLEGGFSEYLASAHGIPMPLPMREKSGTISHPVACDGWYWSPEAALVATHPKAQLLGAWIFHHDNTYPFSWVKDDYDHRVQLQHEGNPAEKVIKWMLASLYGRLAQRVGWDEKTRKPPAWHQLEWAGFITSMCRSMCYRAAIDVARRNGLVSIDTDGIMATVPFSSDALQNGEGEGLGEWKVEEFGGLIYIQNGIYWLRDKETGEWIEPKLRGIPREQVKDEQAALKALEGDGKIQLTKNSFVGYGQALNSDWGRWRTWETRPHEIDVNNSGKRQHVKKLCRACRAGYGMTECLHDLAPMLTDSVVSKPHELPWMNPKKIQAWQIMKEYAIADDL